MRSEISFVFDNNFLARIGGKEETHPKQNSRTPLGSNIAGVPAELRGMKSRIGLAPRVFGLKVLQKPRGRVCLPEGRVSNRGGRAESGTTRKSKSLRI